jgi:hypothetical protein
MRCFGRYNGYLIKCHERAEDSSKRVSKKWPWCKMVEECYQNYIKKQGGQKLEKFGQV